MSSVNLCSKKDNDQTVVIHQNKTPCIYSHWDINLVLG